MFSKNSNEIVESYEIHENIDKYQYNHYDCSDSKKKSEERKKNEFFAACYNGDINKLTELADRGERDDLHFKENSGLMLACMFGHSPIVKFLVERKICNVGMVGAFKKTALMHACCSSYPQIEIIRTLVSTGESCPEKQNSSGNTALMLLVTNSYIRDSIHCNDFFNTLLSTGNCNLFAVNKNNQTALSLASFHHLPFCVIRLIDYYYNDKVQAEKIPYFDQIVMLGCSKKYVIASIQCMIWLLKRNMKLPRHYPDNDRRLTKYYNHYKENTNVFKLFPYIELSWMIVRNLQTSILKKNMRNLFGHN